MKSQKGFSLIEVLISLALLGMIAVAFLSALATSFRATLIMDERATARNLATSEMEYVKSQDYAAFYDPAQIPEYYGYTPSIGVEPLYNEDGSQKDGIQKITVTIKHDDKVVTTLEGYKVYR